MRHLDTNTVIAYLNGNQVVAARLKLYVPDIAASTLVLAELLYGALASFVGLVACRTADTLDQTGRGSADPYLSLVE